MSLDCSSCHGGGGGGGMAAPLTNPIWIYGKDDDTLFRLIVLGTVKSRSRDTEERGRNSWWVRCHPSVTRSKPSPGSDLKSPSQP